MLAAIHFDLLSQPSEFRFHFVQSGLEQRQRLPGFLGLPFAGLNVLAGVGDLSLGLGMASTEFVTALPAGGQCGLHFRGRIGFKSAPGFLGRDLPLGFR